MHSSRLGTEKSVKCNVLFVIDQLCELGGAEKVLLNTIDLLDRDRFAPSVLTFKIDSSIPAFAKIPCKVTVLPLRKTWDLNGIKTALRLRRLIKEDSIHIVHTFFETSDLWAGPIARLSGVPVIVSSRRDMGILRSGKHHWAYRVAGLLVDQIQTVSEQVRAYCIAADRVREDKVMTLYNGVSLKPNPEVTPDLLTSPAFRGASHVITNVAHVRYVKGIDVFLQAAAVVRREFPDAVFLVVGKNHDTEHYEQVIGLRDSLNLRDWVFFTGAVDDVAPILGVSDVFCMLSRSEGLSNSILEAMASKLPCVVTDVGGNRELIVDGRNGFLVKSEDPEAAAGALLRLLRDPELRTTFGNQGRRMVEENFTIEIMMNKLVAAYDSLLRKAASKRRWSLVH